MEDTMIGSVSWTRPLTLDETSPSTIHDFVETNQGHASEGFIIP